MGYEESKLPEGSNCTLEFGKGTMDFTATTPNSGDFESLPYETLESNKENDTEEKFSLITGDDTLEMGFVSDVLSPILEAEKAIASENGIDFQISFSEDLPGVWLRPKALQCV